MEYNQAKAEIWQGYLEILLAEFNLKAICTIETTSLEISDFDNIFGVWCTRWS